MSLFQNARNVTINDGRFFAINGDYGTISMPVGNAAGIQALSQAISHGAMHDSSERDPPPRCHPGTRKKVAEDIVQWIRNPNALTSVLWVNGRAGVGKSALMQTIAELLRANNLDLGGCFFFRRKVPRCDGKGFFFSTLAYQFAINVAGMREHINQAMEDNPALPMKSAAIQLQKLILEPFMRLPTPRPCPVVIIDGLDECDASEAQRDILTLVCRASTTPEITIRFIIASRPEYQITQMFNKEPLLRMTCRLVLDEDYESHSDIVMYLRDGFTEIRERNDMAHSEDSWPSDSQIEKLAWRASGQFIYATTVLKFIGSDFCDPAEQLHVILHPSPMQATAFSELDRLYAQILSVYPNPEFLKSVLGVITLFGGELLCSIPGTYSSFIADILGAGEGKVCTALRALQSLTIVDSDATAPSIAGTVQLFQDVQFSHKSFLDFLMDETRSRQYFVAFNVFQTQVLCRAFDLVIEAVRSSASPSKPTTSVQISTWRQLEFIFQSDGSNYSPSFSRAIQWLKLSNQMVSQCNFKELRLILSDARLQQMDAPSPHVFPALYFANSAFTVLRIHPLLLELHDTMNKLFMDTRKFLDICFRKALGASVIDANSLVGHLAFDFSRSSIIPYKSPPIMVFRPVNNICKMWNIPDPLNVQNLLCENSHLIWSHFYPQSLRSYHGYKTISYSVCPHLHEFLTDPSRAQHLYQHFWTLRVRKCQEAIRKVIERIDWPGGQEEEFFYEDYQLALGIREYFEQNHGISSSSTGILDLRGVENAYAHMALHSFLIFLSEVPWAEVFLATDASTMITLIVVSRVCDYLESSSALGDPTRGVIELVYRAVLTNGILPKFRQQAILMEQLLTNDEATLSLILGWVSALQKSPITICNGVKETHPQLSNIDGLRMHHLFKGIAHELLDTVMQNLVSSFGTTSLEELLFQRVKRLLLPTAGFPMHYWGMVDVSTLPRPPPKDGSRPLALDTLFFLCLELPKAGPSGRFI